MKEFDFIHYLKALHYAVQHYVLTYDNVGLMRFIESFSKEDIDVNVLKTLLIATEDYRYLIKNTNARPLLLLAYTAACKKLNIKPV